ncbi:GHKL domain-containing protein [Bacillus thuringiensis]|nr:GHKL domain-containing protein [Bacillus thuringiensis]
MKRFNRLSLQMRITVLTGMILTIVSVAMTVFAISNGQQLIMPAQESVPAMETISPNNEFIPSTNTTDQIEMKQTFDYRSIIFGFFSIVIGTGLVYIVSGHAIKPVIELKKGIEKIDESNLSERLEKKDASEEIIKLTDSVNHMLDRIEEAFSRQKQFAASAAHELKTPLSIMKASLQVTNKEIATQSEEEIKNNALQLKNINRLSQIVDDLLLIANTTQFVEIINEEVYLDLLLEEIIEELSPLYQEYQINLVLNLEECIIIGNPDLLYRVFYNLIENAYKYNELNGEIWIKSYLKNDDLKIEICNTGKTIDNKHINHLTDAFYRVDSSWSREYSGAGLGLTIVKNILERHEIEWCIKNDKNNFTCINLIQRKSKTS